MPLIETKGAASAQGFGFTLGGAEPVYIEQIFSTYLYTGNGSTQTITNGIDLAGKGGMVWNKPRSAAGNHFVNDTVRGATKYLRTNLTDAEGTDAGGLFFGSFTSSGFTTGSFWTDSMASWTFRKQPKFFDVVTYTGNGGSGGRAISHSLGSTPGCIMVKAVDSTSAWSVWHRSGNVDGTIMFLNTTAAGFANNGSWFGDGTNPVAPTATNFTIDRASATYLNQSGVTYVAYLFAHNAGGFGLTGTDNVISCGSYTGNGSATGPTVTLGYEPQWVMVKAASTTGNWVIEDVMRGMSQTASNELFPNTSGAETALNPGIIPNATGFSLGTTNADMNSNGVTYIYIAIRRGPMKTPTSGTSVFFPTTNGAIGSSDWSAAPLSEKSVDCIIGNTRTSSPNSGFIFTDRLRGLNGSYSTSTSANLNSTSTAAETTATYPLQLGDSQGSIDTNRTAPNSITYLMKRAPGFFDVVCYTGTGSDLTVNHNLGVTPELILTIPRSPSDQFAWGTMTPAGQYSNLRLYSNGALTFSTGITRTSTTYVAPSSLNASVSATKYVTYLFASCPGVSKVTNFTGNGSTQTINCGFTTGARFVLIKATSTTGDWLVFDTARGMTTSTDPWLALNSTAAESATTGACTTVSSGFAVDESKLTGINTNGVSYIALAIA